MRKINKSSNVPATLANAPVPGSTAEVRESIYKADDVRCQLIADQHNKCCYCECSLTKSFNDVEHYRYKAHYYWLGHNWDNLLYSCNLCNRVYKNNRFPLAQGSVTANTPADDLSLEHPLIINPAHVDPATHIKFRRYEAVYITPEGKETIEMFDLNNKNGGRKELLENRKQLYEEYIEIKKQLQLAQNLISQPDISQEVKNIANEWLISCNRYMAFKTSPSTPYSGMLIAQI